MPRGQSILFQGAGLGKESSPVPPRRLRCGLRGSAREASNRRFKTDLHMPRVTSLEPAVPPRGRTLSFPTSKRSKIGKPATGLSSSTPARSHPSPAPAAHGRCGHAVRAGPDPGPAWQRLRIT